MTAMKKKKMDKEEKKRKDKKRKDKKIKKNTTTKDNQDNEHQQQEQEQEKQQPKENKVLNKKEEESIKSVEKETVQQEEQEQEQKWDEEYEEEDYDDDDERKLFLTRIPSTFTSESIIRLFEKTFGKNCIRHLALIENKKDNDDDDDETKDYNNQDTNNNNNNPSSTTQHRGFAFLTMKTKTIKDEAINKGTIRGSAKENSKRKHTLYIRNIVREDENEDTTNVCYRWSKYRCPYGDNCKFQHVGSGGCIDPSITKTKKKQKCFAFTKTGKCKLGDDCPFRHDFKCPIATTTTKKEKSEKDCINWKSKGKCRKGDKCPYKHDEAVRQAFLQKKEKKKKRKQSELTTTTDTNNNISTKRQEKRLLKNKNPNPQPLSIRVFGLNYSTTQSQVKSYFETCGKIQSIGFPTFDDSNRSKGYCMVLYTSPQATEKACQELNGKELHGRWLSVQPGKMYLKQWEEMERKRMLIKDDSCTIDDGDGDGKEEEETALIGEYGQMVKRRKRHGYKD